MLVLLFLSVWVPFGFSYEELYYGDTFRTWVSSGIQTIELTNNRNPTAKVVWNRDDPSAGGEDGRLWMDGSYFVIDRITQRDSGRYSLRDKDHILQRYKILEVIPRQQSETRNPGDYFSIDFDVEPDSCNVYYTSNFLEADDTNIVRRGRIVTYYAGGCSGFEAQYSCRLVHYDLPKACSGVYVVRDKEDNQVMELSLAMEDPYEPAVDATHIGIGVGVSLGVLCCCTCMRRCCCKKSSKKGEAESPDAEPANSHPTYDREPVGPRRDQASQPSETLYPTLPSYNQSTPLIHNPPPADVPPAYSEASLPTERVDAPTFPVPSDDPGPRFELSIPSALPLSSDSDFSHVYTSDKLNF
ncbi:uncharacterized protein LOC121516255 isoform X1 [Xyrichtys novacula]|uniref:Uncharacterized protein LOC121516255 isoform X1 n=1 Tax=Xyrichtys novacula TaxID=13765 RepID=A0AAV1FAZ7_XYRNO|nr:uncharacterized protein LOC121516255 isoform X1 [Xyrichtys novacula]